MHIYFSPSDSLPRYYNGLECTNVEAAPVSDDAVFSKPVSWSGPSSCCLSSYVVLIHVAPISAANYSFSSQQTVNLKSVADLQPQHESCHITA